MRIAVYGKIDVQIIKDKDVVVKTNNGLILQVLINLIDNAIYWVNKNERKKTEIAFKINTKDNTLIVADNGPGIREDVEPLIFNEFFSGTSYRYLAKMRSSATKAGKYGVVVGSAATGRFVIGIGDREVRGEVKQDDAKGSIAIWCDSPRARSTLARRPPPASM